MHNGPTSFASPLLTGHSCSWTFLWLLPNSLQPAVPQRDCTVRKKLPLILLEAFPPPGSQGLSIRQRTNDGRVPISIARSVGDVWKREQQNHRLRQQEQKNPHLAHQDSRAMTKAYLSTGGERLPSFRIEKRGVCVFYRLFRFSSTQQQRSKCVPSHQQHDLPMMTMGTFLRA